MRRIAVCASLDKCSCGDLLFHALLPPPPPLTSRDNSPVVMRRRGRESHRLQVPVFVPYCLLLWQCSIAHILLSVNRKQEIKVIAGVCDLVMEGSLQILSPAMN